MKPLTVNKP